MRISNYEAHEYVSQRIPFEGSNLFAEFHHNGAYVVYSYGRHFPIYAFVDGQWFGNRDKYSRSTTRHQNQARPVWDSSKIWWLDTTWMRRVIAEGVSAIVKNRILGR